MNCIIRVRATVHAQRKNMTVPIQRQNNIHLVYVIIIIIRVGVMPCARSQWRNFLVWYAKMNRKGRETERRKWEMQTMKFNILNAMQTVNHDKYLRMRKEIIGRKPIDIDAGKVNKYSQFSFISSKMQQRNTNHFVWRLMAIFLREIQIQPCGKKCFHVIAKLY